MNMTTIQKIFAIAIFFIILSCENAPKRPEIQKMLGQEMWLTTNLRVFEGKNIYWQNYAYGKILSWGTSVRLVQSNSDTIRFVDNQSNEFMLHWRRDAKSEWEKEMPRYLSQENLQETIESIEEPWKTAISFGNVQRGMSKQMVLWSRGYPVFPSNYEKEDVWVYYEDQARQTLVYFENNIVVHIVSP